MAFSYFSKARRHRNFRGRYRGKWDSTNVFIPILTAITTIGLDHTDILGETEGRNCLAKSWHYQKKHTYCYRKHFAKCSENN